jgi:hypothetical protein
VIQEIRNPYLRRAVLVFTVLSIVACMGPLRLVQAVLRWVEDEFDADLLGVWNGVNKRRKL